MKNYRCVFTYSGGNTTIEIDADDCEQALEAAAAAITAGDFDRADVWDGDTVLLTRTTPRAWDALGDVPTPPPAAESNVEQPQTAPMPAGLPRRTPSLLTAGLKALKLGTAKAHLQRMGARRG